MCEQDCCCKGCCYGSTCNKVLRAFSFALCILAFCIHAAALGHTEWMCPSGGCSLFKPRMSLFHALGALGQPSTALLDDPFKRYEWIPACWAFAALALGSSFMAFIFIAVRMCKVKKGCEIAALFFLFGAFGCEFLTWVIFVGKMESDFSTTTTISGIKTTFKANPMRQTWTYGQGFNCSIASMVISFIIFVMTAVSVKMNNCQPIVSKEKVDTVVVVQAAPGQVVVAGQPTYAANPGYVEQAPPAYAEPEKQPVY